ncbi:MAG: hypothetical protein QXO94_04505 [Candidatus Bathyarchaeia archaeon]
METPSKSQETFEFRCERCGSLLRVTPETIVALCNYCGHPTALHGTVSLDRIFIVPSKPREDILEAFNRRLDKDADMKRIRRQVQVFGIEGLYYPFWTAEVSMRGHAIYIRYEHRGSGKKARLERRRYEEDFNLSLPIGIMARRQALTFGLPDLLDYYRASSPQENRLLDVGEEDWRRGTRLNLLAPEFDEVEATNRLAEDAVDAVRKGYKRKGQELEFFNAQVERVSKVKLILLPLWRVTYAFRGSLFQILHAGWDGKPIVATEPVLIFRRLLYVLGSLFACLVGGFGAILLERGYTEFGLMIFGLSIILGLGLGRRLTADIRIEGRRRIWA